VVRTPASINAGLRTPNARLNVRPTNNSLDPPMNGDGRTGDSAPEARDNGVAGSSKAR